MTAIRFRRDVARQSTGLALFAKRLPWWLKVTLIFLLGRAITTALLYWMIAIEGANPWTVAHPGYLDFANIWDGRWYEIVALAGYPDTLTVGYSGHIAQNAWAFLPGYPAVVRGVMSATGLSWQAAAVGVSVVFGYAATLLFFKLMRLRLNPSTALHATLLFCVTPVSALFQVAYAESMYTFLLVALLYLVLRRRYWWSIPVIVIAAFTRPGGLAVALFLGLHVAVRFWRRRREPFGATQIAGSLLATAFALTSGVAWPLIASWVTGIPGAYMQTELAWRASYIGWVELTPFTSWFQAAGWWFTVWLGLSAWVGWVVVGLLVVLFATVLFLPSVVRLGTDIRLWLAAYAAYLLAVWFPQSSTFRVLLPMFPLAGAIAQPRSVWYRLGMVVASVAGQLGWLLLCWTIGANDWSPP